MMELGIKPKIAGIPKDNPCEMGKPKELMSHGEEQPVEQVAVRSQQLQNGEEHECG